MSRKTEKLSSGFCVPQDVALAVLERKSAAAAAWFREHGFPEKGGSFIFNVDAVEIIEAYGNDELPGPLTVYDNTETGTMRPVS